MEIIVVDDEHLVAQDIVQMLKQVEPEAEVATFTKPQEVFSYLSQHKVDTAFLDIEIGAYSGIELALECKKLCPYINIIFVTGYGHYMPDAFRLHASGYLLKPASLEDLRGELNNLRHPISRLSVQRVRIQTFGFFELFVDRRPLKFPRAKSKECLAYLVDRKGAGVTYSDLSAVLWEDTPFDRTVRNHTQKVVSDMYLTLKKVGAENIIAKGTRDIAIVPETVDCDYYAALAGDVAQLNTFTGEYMTNYSWAEFTLGGLFSSGQC